MKKIALIILVVCIPAFVYSLDYSFIEDMVLFLDEDVPEILKIRDGTKFTVNETNEDNRIVSQYAVFYNNTVKTTGVKITSGDYYEIDYISAYFLNYLGRYDSNISFDMNREIDGVSGGFMKINSPKYTYWLTVPLLDLEKFAFYFIIEIEKKN